MTHTSQENMFRSRRRTTTYGMTQMSETMKLPGETGMTNNDSLYKMSHR